MERRTQRPRIADVARAAGVSKTAVSFAFNSPERLAAGTATRIREVADSLGYRPNPVARLLTQRSDDDARHSHAPFPRGHVLEPVLRRVQRGRGADRGAARLRAPFHLATPWLVGAGDGARDRGWRGRDRPLGKPSGGRPGPGSRPADGASSTPTTCRATAPSSSTTRGAPVPPRSTCSAWGIGSCSSSRWKAPRARPTRVRQTQFGVAGRRLRGYRAAFDAAGGRPARRRGSSPGARPSTAARPHSGAHGPRAIDPRPSWR